ncbi:MAG: N-6 DNA methylase [Polyangiaceae bacterium]|nr:N-6 DNA methylase [Polyangiaceae bacterium]
MKDRDFLFHERWLGLAQPIEGLVFSVPVLADAQIAPELRPELSAAFGEHVVRDEIGPRIRHLPTLLRTFLGYAQAGMLVPRAELPEEISFYASEGGQELRPSFALARGPFADVDPFAAFEAAAPAAEPAVASPSARFFALVWDVTEHGPDIDLDEPEAVTGPWKYPPTAKLERLLRHVGVPIGLLFNGRHLRLVHAPAGETSGHLTFRVEHMEGPDGRPVLAAMELLLHARRAYGSAAEFTLGGLLAESRHRQADVTEKLAKQVFEAVELLVAGFEAAALRDGRGERLDWLRPALEAEGDHFYQGILSVVLRLVFLLYSEDQSLLPVEHRTYAEHLSLAGLYQRLSHDAGAHPESMHHRFGAYGQLLALFRAVFFGVKHGGLDLPPRRGRLFDPNAYPFLEGGQPEWTAAVVDPEARAATHPPSVDDGTIYRVLHRLVVFEGQRLSYRTLDVEQIGSVYESLMGYHVLRLTSPAVRMGKLGVWVETEALRKLTATDRARYLKETCGLNPGPVQAIEKAVKDAAGDDAALLEALSAHAVGKRADILQHRANVGRLVLQPGEERRRTGSHYTPRSLTEKVVRRTLEPLLACLGDDRAPAQILELKICDPAMGSGAFLVATCRELAGEMVAAWTRRGELAQIIDEHGDAHLHARRLVAQKCLYGVDKNPAAVELAKLSLWLVTLSRTLPFTFVDHALRHGDSLVGLEFKQIEAFHWKPSPQMETRGELLREALDQAVALRQEIVALGDRDDPSSQAEKRRLFEFSQQAIDRVRLVADVCVGAFFAEAKDAAREKERARRFELVKAWLDGGDGAERARAELEEMAAIVRKAVSPFHWWIEFPEVFFEERPDPLQGGVVNGAALMEGVVGNPPFGGKNNIVESGGLEYQDWLKAVVPGDRGVRGACDLSAYFFRRAVELLGENGCFGLVATNSIAQGDTRSIGLQHLALQGWMLYDAMVSMPWPGAAAVTVSTVHAARGAPLPLVSQTRLDGAPVPALNSRLRPGPERADPVPLGSQQRVGFQGAIILGMGFVISPERAAELASHDPGNSKRLSGYLGGEEVNTNPRQLFDRYVVNFGQLTLEEASAWPDLLAILRERVKPERDALPPKNSWNRDVAKRWWQFGATRPELRAALSLVKRCLVTARVSKHLMLSFQPPDRTFSEQLYVFALGEQTAFAVLQSRVHERWARLLSSSLEDRLRYSASDCFETFPFPQPDPRAVLPHLEAIGETLYTTRADYMVATNQGLTRTYNALKDPTHTDPRIVELRRLHEELDRAVLAAYGWADIAVPPFCPSTDADRAALQAFEDEVIDRLYVLNAERARDEQRLGLAGKRAPRAVADEGDEMPQSAPPKARGRGKTKAADAAQKKLF